MPPDGQHLGSHSLPKRRADAFGNGRLELRRSLGERLEGLPRADDGRFERRIVDGRGGLRKAASRALHRLRFHGGRR